MDKNEAREQRIEIATRRNGLLHDATRFVGFCHISHHPVRPHTHATQRQQKTVKLFSGLRTRNAQRQPRLAAGQHLTNATANTARGTRHQYMHP